MKLKSIFTRKNQKEGATVKDGMSRSKKIIIATAMVLVLALAAYLNIVLLDGGAQAVSGDEVSGDIFMTYRANRQTSRNEEISSLEAVLALTGSEYEESRKEAANSMLKIVELMETELILESLIKAKGYDDAVVNMGIYSENVNVMIKCDELTRQDTAIIYSIIAEETGIDPNCVKIIQV
ncbi:MAG: SpoIIIAH-like family protein [Clostridia bacterium]|nr:SpoIIIAH-like family protein [Clostridia bacterium]